VYSMNQNEDNFNAYQEQTQQNRGMRVVERGEKKDPHKFNLRDNKWILVLILFLVMLAPAFIVLLKVSIESFMTGDMEEGWWNLFGCGFILLFLAIPFIIVFLSTRSNKRVLAMKENGLCAKLPITEIIFTNSYSNHVPGYRITVSNPDRLPGFLFNYESRTIYSYDIEWLREGQLMPVYVDRTDPTKFHMDVDAAVYDAKMNHDEHSDFNNIY